MTIEAAGAATVTPAAAPAKADGTVKEPVVPAKVEATPAAKAATTAKVEEKPGSLLGEPAKVEEVKPAGAAAKADYSGLKLPDGSMLPPATLDAVRIFAEKHNLTAEAAQAELEERHGAVKSHFESLVQSHKTKVEEWKKAVQTHPKFGGANLKATDEAVTQVMTRFAPKGLMGRVQEAGYNWDPEFVEFLHNIHEATKSDTFVSGKGATTQPPTPGRLEDMYRT